MPFSGAPLGELPFTPHRSKWVCTYSPCTLPSLGSGGTAGISLGVSHGEWCTPSCCRGGAGWERVIAVPVTCAQQGREEPGSVSQSLVLEPTESAAPGNLSGPFPDPTPGLLNQRLPGGACELFEQAFQVIVMQPRAENHRSRPRHLRKHFLKYAFG